MAIYSVDVRDGMIRRVTQDCHKVNNKRCFLIEAGSGKQAWAKATSAPAANGSAVCGSCRHRLCSFCEDCSATKRYLDYWICHFCGELKRRVQNLQSRGLTGVVSVKLGERIK